jgi:hypothetical protein
MRSHRPGEMNKARQRRTITPNTISIRLGCEIEKVMYQSRGRGRVTSIEYKTWRETFIVPEQGYNRINLTCPICHLFFALKIYSKSRARLRKIYFASCFLAIAACAIALGVFARSDKGFMGYSLSAPFICFAVWQLWNVIRRRFDAGDVVSHAGGKVHRIFDEHKIIFPDP